MERLQETTLTLIWSKSELLAQCDRKLRTACETLCQAPATLITGLSVSWRACDDLEVIQTIAGRAYDLADEHGLEAEVELRGHLMSVGYSRVGHESKVDRK